MRNAVVNGGVVTNCLTQRKVVFTFRSIVNEAMSNSSQPPLDTEEIIADTPEESAAVDYEALYRRALADQENARKRAAQERLQVITFATQSLIEDIIPVLDTFTRAIAHVPVELAESQWAQGVLYIEKQLTTVLTEKGVSLIEPKLLAQFDSAMHEAVTTVSPEDPNQDGLIAAVLDRGYQLGDRVVRPARVSVYHIESDK